MNKKRNRIPGLRKEHNPHNLNEQLKKPPPHHILILNIMISMIRLYLLKTSVPPAT